MAQQSRGARTESSSIPIVTYLLIVAQVVAWVVVRRYLLPDSWAIFAIRAHEPNPLGLLVSPFVHLEPAHLGINLAVLWLFGTNLERAIGSPRFAVVYLGAAWFAAIMHWAALTSFQLYPEQPAADPAVGSSGAIAGVLGASLVRFAQDRQRIPFFRGATFPVTPIIVCWLVYTLVRALATTVSGATEGIGHWAHFAGFIFGMGIAQVAGLHRAARQEFLERTAREAAARADLVSASQAWSALLSLRPGDVEVRTSLTAARLALGDGSGARGLARDGITTLVRANERGPALAAYREAVGMIPDLDLPPGIRYRVGCWLADAGEPELAFRALWESVREDGATPATASALHRAGQVAWERLRNGDLARQAWERLLEQFPDSPFSDAARDGLRRLPAAG